MLHLDVLKRHLSNVSQAKEKILAEINPKDTNSSSFPNYIPLKIKDILPSGHTSFASLQNKEAWLNKVNESIGWSDTFWQKLVNLGIYSNMNLLKDSSDIYFKALPRSFFELKIAPGYHSMSGPSMYSSAKWKEPFYLPFSSKLNAYLNEDIQAIGGQAELLLPEIKSDLFYIRLFKK